MIPYYLTLLLPFDDLGLAGDVVVVEAIGAALGGTATTMSRLGGTANIYPLLGQHHNRASETLGGSASTR
jgi:hypothetical protein